MTVITSVSFASVPFFCIESARMPMAWSPSTMLPCSSQEMRRSASPSKAKPMSAPLATTSCCSRSGCSAPHSSLMFMPSGQQNVAITVAPSRSNTSRPMAEVAPLAQSSTTLSPSKRPADLPAR